MIGQGRQRKGKREFIPATNFFITVIGIRQKKTEKKGNRWRRRERKGKSKQQRKSQQKPTRTAESTKSGQGVKERHHCSVILHVYLQKEACSTQELNTKDDIS